MLAGFPTIGGTTGLFEFVRRCNDMLFFLELHQHKAKRKGEMRFGFSNILFIFSTPKSNPYINPFTGILIKVLFVDDWKDPRGSFIKPQYLVSLTDQLQ